jgi:hypothetical protein
LIPAFCAISTMPVSAYCHSFHTTPLSTYFLSKAYELQLRKSPGAIWRAHLLSALCSRAYYRGMATVGPCAELLELKRQYEYALRAWGQYQFPRHNEQVGTRAWRSEQLQLKQRALDARNAANDCVLDHKRICPLCTGKDCRTLSPAR